MKTIKDIMSGQPIAASPDQSLADIANTMHSQAIGIMPVRDEGKIVGVLTDRDIVIRGLAQRSDPLQMCARDAMTSPAACAHAGDSVEAAAKLMQERHVRRLPVLDEQERLVGVVSLDDIAAQASTQLAGDTLKAVTTEREPNIALA